MHSSYALYMRTSIALRAYYVTLTSPIPEAVLVAASNSACNGNPQRRCSQWNYFFNFSGLFPQFISH